MKIKKLIFPVVVSSLFMPSIEALERTTDLNSLESENNIYEAVDILIAEGGGGGGGGGGGQKPSDKKAQEEKRKKAQDAAKKRNACKKNENDCSKKGVESNKKEKIAISKLDDVGTSFRGGLVKEQIKKLTAKIAIASISNISAKIVKLQDEAKNINPANIDEWLKKTDEIALKIAALEDLQKRIDDHLNYIIDSVVYCIKFIDNPLLKTEGVKVLQKKAIYMDNYYSLWAKAEPAGIINAELGRALKDIDRLTLAQFDYLSDLF